ncbi:unnamed protein product [Symbiodinium sp. CCMP2592]|nr:unnamed protein product [Symbiodinium sp. CCMP2592]
MAAPSSVTLVPMDGTDIGVTLASLGHNFGLDDKVVQALVATKVQNLEELRYFFADEAAVDPWLKKTSLGEEHNIQAARLRRCWAAVRLYFSQSEADRSKVALADLDCILGEGELRDLKTNFWRRYRQRFPPEVHPSDHQLLSSVKKRKLAPNLYTEDDDPEEAVVKDSDSYLDRLFTLCLSYALAGTTAMPGAPAALDEATLGADSTAFVAVPLDVAMTYWFRAKRTAAAIPAPRRLSWLQARDQEERTEWVARFRDSQKSLDQVMKEVFIAHDPHWLPMLGGGSLFQTMANVAGKKVAAVMKDGKVLCQDYQRGKCNRAPSAQAPLLADLMSGPEMPIAKAFLWCGWRVLPVDLLIDPSHDLADARRQKSLEDQLQDAAFLFAALDCSTKSRAREIPRVFEDGRAAPGPLRSGRYPEGLPSLSGAEAERVRRDNAACSWVLQQMQKVHARGGGCIRENPANSLHWRLPAEVEMQASGEWYDTTYSACVFAGARCKSQRRHNVDEIASWPPLSCQHFHNPAEWDPVLRDGHPVYPSKEEAEYTAPLSFSIAIAASWWAARKGFAVMRFHRLPPVERTGRCEHWLDIDPRALRSWAMAPLAISLGLRPVDVPGTQDLPSRDLAETKVLEKGAVVLRFRKLFPEPWFHGFRFPMIEDLVNQAPFDLFSRWLAERDGEWEGPLVPVAADRQQRLRQRTADGQQVGASNHRAALPPLLPFGLSVDEHFERSLCLGTQPLPTERPPVLDSDLLFAASVHAQQRGNLRGLRQRAIGALTELKRRWGSVSDRLRSLQPPAIQRATRQRDLRFTALLLALVSWGDATYPYGLALGLPAVGFAPPYGIFPEQQVPFVSFEQALGDWQEHNATTIKKLKPGKLDQVLLEQSTGDAQQGFCTPPLSFSALQREVRGLPFRVIPRCVITQGSGKHRIIDNAADGGQSAASSDSNKLVLCSPLRPAQHLRATIDQMSEEQLQEARESEDWPNAYRHSPMDANEARACVVCFWHHEWQQPAFQVYAGLLFGLPLAVTSFNRYSRLVESLRRRLLLVLVSLYFDDANLGDWRSSRGSGQWAFGQLNTLLGTPFAEHKRQPMATTGDFLGLSHDVSQAISAGVIRFWPRPRIVSKLYGILNFFEQGVYSGSLWAIKERQNEASTALTQDLAANFRYVRAIIRARPERLLAVISLPCDRFVAASDAAEEPATGGTGGFLVVWFSGLKQTREGFVADIQPWWYEVWQPAEVHIAQLEISMLAYALLCRPHQFRNRRGFWFLDNLAALLALVKGRSAPKDLERFAHMVHILLLGLNTQMWFEYIPSKSNWADSISRLGWADPWHPSQSFSTRSVHFPRVVWDLPPAALLTLAHFL